MELDTGASVSVICEERYKKIWGPNPPPLKGTSTVLKAYGGKAITVLGVLPVQVKVKAGDKPKALELHVVQEKCLTLLGRDWLTQIRLDWEEIFQFRWDRELDRILKEYQRGIGEVAWAAIHVDPSTPPRSFKARKVPYALREKLEEALF